MVYENSTTNSALLKIQRVWIQKLYANPVGRKYDLLQKFYASVYNLQLFMFLQNYLY